MKKLLSGVALLLVLSMAMTGCGKATAEDDGKLSVVSTIFAPYDFARELTGELANVKMLLPPGSEAHSFEPTPQDILAIQNSDLFIYVGGESDAWVEEILGTAGDVRAVTLMDCVEALNEETVDGMQLEAGESGDEYDEHVWTSPRNAKLICEKLAAALVEADPANAEAYKANLERYTAELDKLDAAFKEVVENGARKTIVFADRFPLLYFARAYDLDYYAAFPSCADDAEPSAATVAFIIDKVKEENIPAVFHIELANEGLADTVCEATGAKKLQFSTCHNVTRGELEAGVSYLSLMWANVDALKEALG